MKISEILKTTFRTINEFGKKFFGDNPEQYVESNDDETLLAAAVTGSNISKAEAAELVKAFRDAEKNGDYHTKVIGSSIKLDSEENGFNTTTSKSERESSYRDSEAIRNIRDKRNDTSAKDLPNIEREHGGEARSRGR